MNKLILELTITIAFLFLWWVCGVGATTFVSTGSFAGTQYFSTWCALIFSAFIMHSEWEQFRHALSSVQKMEASNRPLFYLLLASLIEAISAAFVCGDNSCVGLEIYALIVGIFSLLLCVLLLRVDSDKFQGSDKAIVLFLALWWSAAMGVL